MHYPGLVFPNDLDAHQVSEVFDIPRMVSVKKDPVKHGHHAVLRAKDASSPCPGHALGILYLGADLGAARNGGFVRDFGDDAVGKEERV